jgi:hypothetical protein
LGYRRTYGTDNSWELDALQPSYLVKLVEAHISSVIDVNAWHARREEINSIKVRLSNVAKDFK